MGLCFLRISCPHRDASLLSFAERMKVFTILPSRLARDSELPHLSEKSCPVQSESGSSTIPPADDPVGFTEGRKDVRPICIRQRAHDAIRHLLIRELRKGSSQLDTLGQNNRALNEVLQFPDIARPVV